MLRNSLLGAAGVLVTGLLIFLMIQSSAVDSEYYVDFGTRINLLRQGDTDYSSLSESVQNSYREGHAVPGSAVTALQRLESNRDELKQLLENESDARITGAFQAYSDSLTNSAKSFREFIEQQSVLANNVSILRDESPSVVRDLRRFSMQALSQTVFGIAVEVLDYAGGAGSQGPDVLLQRLDTLEKNRTVQTRIPGKLDKLAGAAREIIKKRGEAGETLLRIGASTAPDAARQLQATLREINRTIVGRADRARTLLAVFSLLFLAGIAYTAVKLRQSYSELSDSKAELEQLNHSLEERVEARTEQLTTAYEDLKESQAQLVHAEKMSSLGELVAGISHEINTPLWYLISNSTMLQERLQSFDEFVQVAEALLDQLRNGDKDKQKFVERLQELDNLLVNEALRDDLEESVDLVRDSIEGLEQLAEMAQGLKDFSRLDRSAVDRFSVNEGIDKSLLIASNFLKNRVTVNKKFAEVPPIMCAPSQINQIFLNLIKNASDAIDGKGTINITTSHEGDNVVIRIEDSGSGIPADVITKIRDPFFTTKEVGKGTGLGLSIVDKIINTHCGEMQIASVPGEGSTFTVTLPINRTTEDTQSARLEAEIDALEQVPMAAAS